MIDQTNNDVSANKYSKPQGIIENEDDRLPDLEWSDFADDFNPNDINRAASKEKNV